MGGETEAGPMRGLLKATQLGGGKEEKGGCERKGEKDHTDHIELNYILQNNKKNNA